MTAEVPPLIEILQGLGFDLLLLENNFVRYREKM
jgi:hypothetical protein